MNFLPDYPSYNESDLLSRFAGGDKAAFDMIFRQWYARLVIFSERYYKGQGEADEIVSEAFLKAWQTRTRFEALPKLKSFLYTVVRNQSLDAARRAQVRANQLWPLAQANLEHQVNTLDEVEMMKAEVIGALYQAIEGLPERPREVILLSYREGLSSAEIAERLQLSESTVRSHRARAIQLLKETLEHQYPFLLLSINVLLSQLSGRG